MAKLLLGESAVVTTKQLAEQSLGNKVFKLTSEAYTDKYGRPATLWYTDNNEDGHYNGKFNGTAFAVASEYVYLYVHEADQVYTTPIADVTFRELIATYNTLGLKVYCDESGTPTEITVANSAQHNHSGFGTRTEIYVDAANGKVEIVYVNEWVGQVINVANYPATAYQGAYTQYTIKPLGTQPRSANVTVKVFTSHVKDLIEADTGTVEAGVTMGSIVVCTDATNLSEKETVAKTFVEAKLANSFSGVITSYDAANKAVVINGTTYNIAACAYTNGTAAEFKAGLTAQFYVDQYGYIVYTDYTQAVEYAQANYIALYDSKTSSGTAVAKYIEAQLVFADGTTKVVTVDKIIGESKTVYTADGANGTTAISTLGYTAGTGLISTFDLDVLTYTVNETTGAYTLTYVADSKDGAEIFKTQYFAKINNEFPYLANNATTFVVRTGSNAANFKWNVYTGFESLPTLLSGATVTAVDKNNDGIQDLVYIVSDAANTVAHDYVYITSKNYTTTYVAPGVVTVTFPTSDGKGLVVEDPTDITEAGLYLVTEYTPAGAAADGKVALQACKAVAGPGANGLITIGSKTWHYTADSKLVVYVDGVLTEGYTFETLLANSTKLYEYSVKAYVAPQTVVQGTNVVATDWINTAYVVITTNVTAE
jgi:hypothetical protein